MLNLDDYPIRDRLSIIQALDAAKGARQVLFQATHTFPDEMQPFYEQAEKTYVELSKYLGFEPDPVFDVRTYVPNPDRCI